MQRTKGLSKHLSKHLSVQRLLAKHIRDPKTANGQFDARRLSVYQELFFNNVEGFLSNSFPVLKSLFDSASWQNLARRFFIEHSCESPHFIEISEEFLQFLSQTPEALPKPWMLELAHYEWVELAASISDVLTEKQREEGIELISSLHSGSTRAEALLSDWTLVLPQHCFPLAYNYPVHTVSSNNQSVAQQATFLIVYQIEEFEIKFLQSDALTVHWLSSLQTVESISMLDLRALLTGDSINLTQEDADNYLIHAIPDLVRRGCLQVQSNSEP